MVGARQRLERHFLERPSGYVPAYSRGMAVTTLAPAPAPTVELVEPRRWTIEEFERIPDDVLPEGERVELIDGLIYTKVGQNDPHIFAFHYAFRAIQAFFGSGFTIMTQAPTRFRGGSKVEPDILVLRGQIEDYERRRVDPPADVALLVEISDASLSYDRANKALLYAAQGVAEYWIVNLKDRTLEVRRLSEEGAYAEVTVYSEEESVPVNGGAVAVADLLPKVG